MYTNTSFYVSIDHWERGISYSARKQLNLSSPIENRVNNSKSKHLRNVNNLDSFTISENNKIFPQHLGKGVYITG